MTYNRSDTFTGIQARVWVLKDYLHPCSKPAHLFLRQSGDVGTVEKDVAGRRFLQT